MTQQVVVRVDGREIVAKGIHDVFAEVFGFPSFYGRNMNAWIDCMASLDCPGDGMTTVHAPPGGVVVLQIDHFKDLKQQRPDLACDIVECAAFVNWSRLKMGAPAVLCVSFYE